jgi:hypothetical protein
MIACTEPRSVYAEPRSTCPDHLGEIPTLSESVAHHPRRPLASFLGLAPTCPEQTRGISHSTSLLLPTDHSLALAMGLSSLAATLMELPASVANKRLTVLLSPLDATLTKNTGVGTPGVPLFRKSFPYLVISLRPYLLFSKSLPLNLFADPHPLNLYATILYKNSGGWGSPGRSVGVFFPFWLALSNAEAFT